MSQKKVKNPLNISISFGNYLDFNIIKGGWAGNDKRWIRVACRCGFLVGQSDNATGFRIIIKKKVI